MSRVNLDDVILTAPIIKSRMKLGVSRLPDANSTISLDMGPVLSITPGAARTLTLPAVTIDMRGLTYYLVNGAAFAVTVNNASAVAIGVVPATIGATGMFVCLGDSTLGVGGWTGGL
jgi:hypothetical protein